MSRSSLNIEFIGLDWQSTQNKLKQIEAKALTLEISGNKEELIAAINHPKVKAVQFFDSEENISETIYNHEAKKRINQIKSDNLSLKIDNLDIKSVN